MTDDLLELYNALAAPFPVEYVAWRVGPTNDKSRKPDDPLRGQALCYVDARTVMDRLDSVCGFDGWQCSYTPGVGASIVCNIGLHLGGEWVWKADGAGPSDMEAEKGALSDAFKRAAVRWGIGRYLYDIEAPWLTLEKRGNTAFIRKEDQATLAKVHEEFARKAGWGEGAGIAAYRLLLAGLKNLDTETLAGFLANNQGQIAGLPPAMRKHLQQQIDKAAA
jgi:hypothetical protein